MPRRELEIPGSDSGAFVDAGSAVVVLKQVAGWTVGALMNVHTMLALARIYSVLSSFFEMLSIKNERTPSNQLVSIVTFSDQKHASVILTFRNHPFVRGFVPRGGQYKEGSEQNLAKGIGVLRARLIGLPALFPLTYEEGISFARL